MGQIEIIKDQLLQTGQVSRNWCLRNYITRLSGYICKLKKQGWPIEQGFFNKDYIYWLPGRGPALRQAGDKPAQAAFNGEEVSVATKVAKTQPVLFK
jgi:hypothetical protein